MDWIGSILERIRDMQCPNCGARLASCAVRGVTAEPRALVVRLACGVCGEHSVATVERETAPSERPITLDEVIDAHEFLARWDRPVSELVNAPESIESRGAPTGAWRGEVTGGTVEKGPGSRS